MQDVPCVQGLNHEKRARGERDRSHHQRDHPKLPLAADEHDSLKESTSPGRPGLLAVCPQYRERQYDHGADQVTDRVQHERSLEAEQRQGGARDGLASNRYAAKPHRTIAEAQPPTEFTVSPASSSANR